MWVRELFMVHLLTNTLTSYLLVCSPHLYHSHSGVRSRSGEVVRQNEKRDPIDLYYSVPENKTTPIEDSENKTTPIENFESTKVSGSLIPT